MRCLGDRGIDLFASDSKLFCAKLTWTDIQGHRQYIANDTDGLRGIGLFCLGGAVGC